MKNGKVTMSDIAQQVGVSVSTVSLTLNNRAGASIPAETQKRVWDAAKTMHYVGYQKRKRTRDAAPATVLILTSDLTNPYYSILVQRLEKAAAKNNLQFLCSNTYHQVSRERYLLAQAEKNNFCAAIFLYPPDDPENADEVNRRMPVIAICDKDAALGIDLIELNNYRAGCIAAEHLLSCGHERIAIFSSDPSYSTSRANRVKGAMDTIAQAGKQSELFVMDRAALQEAPGDNLNYKIGVALGQKMDVQNHFSAIIAINDMVAMGAMDALANRGVRFPEDMSIIGFDNLLYTSLSRISLTTVDYHTDMLAQAAIDLLYHRMRTLEDETLLATTRFKVECTPNLVLRNTTAALHIRPNTTE